MCYFGYELCINSWRIMGCKDLDLFSLLDIMKTTAVKYTIQSVLLALGGEKVWKSYAVSAQWVGPNHSPQQSPDIKCHYNYTSPLYIS